MKCPSIDPDGYSPKDIIERLHRCIDSGVYGLDYTILSRDKNDEFYSKYIITEQNRIKILRDLSLENHDGWEISDNQQYPNDVIHFFHYTATLFPRGIEEAPAQKVKLYIKLTWTKSGTVLIVISFHD